MSLLVPEDVQGHGVGAVSIGSVKLGHTVRESQRCSL